MAKNYSLLFLLLSQFIFAQIRFSVVDAESREPLTDVQVSCEGKPLGRTDRQGIFKNSGTCNRITVKKSGFEEKSFHPQGVSLIMLNSTRDKSEIQEVIVKDESDPRAIRVLDEYLRRYETNSPKSLPAYRFSGYSKIAIDLAQDSLSVFTQHATARRDSLAKTMDAPDKNGKPKTKDQKKEVENEIAFLNAELQSGLFLWEKVQDFRFSQKLGEKIVIQDSRTSGLKNPIYEFIAVNLSNLNRIPRQVAEDNRYRYRFFLADTLQIEGRDTFVINFRELENKNSNRQRRFTGKIYIDKDTYGLRMIESTSKKANEGDVKSVWTLRQNKWFLLNEDIRTRVGKQNFPLDSIPGQKREKIKFGNYLKIKNRFYDFDEAPNFKPQDFTGYTYAVEKSDGSLLDRLRKDSLSTREMNTYSSIDSLAGKLGVEKKIGLLTSALRGRLRLGAVDVNPGKIFDYNKYEGIRLGIGLKANERFSAKFSPDGYVGYGFQDHHWKFGLGLDTKLSTQKNSILRVEYVRDVAPFGKFSRDLWPGTLVLKDLISYARNGNFYHLRGGAVSWENDLSNSLTVKLAAKAYHEFSDFDYTYQNLTPDFHDISLKASFMWAPKDRNIMTPQGKYTVESAYPKMFLSVEKGLKVFGGDLDYLRAEALLVHRFRGRLGSTSVQLYGGISTGKVPLWKNFEIAGATAQGFNFRQHISLESNLLFYTMPSAEFYATSFAATHLGHTLPFQFKLGKMPSRITLNYAAAYGTFKNREDHNLIFSAPDKLYQEGGLTWNNFFGTALDVGVHYRFGGYHQPKFAENMGFSIGLGF